MYAAFENERMNYLGGSRDLFVDSLTPLLMHYAVAKERVLTVQGDDKALSSYEVNMYSIR